MGPSPVTNYAKIPVCRSSRFASNQATNSAAHTRCRTRSLRAFNDSLRRRCWDLVREADADLCRCGKDELEEQVSPTLVEATPSGTHGVNEWLAAYQGRYLCTEGSGYRLYSSTFLPTIVELQREYTSTSLWHQ